MVSPTYVPDLVLHTRLDLLINGECGLWHLANNSAIAWAEFARLAASMAGVDASPLEACPTRELGLAASSPTYSVLGSELVLLPSLDNAMSRYFDQRQKVF